MELDEIEILTNDNRSEINALRVNLAAAMKLIVVSLTKHGMSEQEVMDMAQQAFNESQYQFDAQAQGDTEGT
jgi:hypothetical protein